MKKKFFITVLFLFGTLAASAQTNIYHPFPDSSAYWNITSSGCCYSNCPGLPVANPLILEFTYTYFLSGDTLVNGLTYDKLYRSGSIHEYCVLGGNVNNWSFVNNEYVGGFRQDIPLKRVYFDSGSGGSECLLYDFNMSVGDTVVGCGQWINDCSIVTSVDSILINGNYRKQFNLATSPPYSIIEGIGSTAGLFEPLCPFEYFGELICFSQNGQTLYSANPGSCNNYTSLDEKSISKKINLRPNPFQYSLTVTLNESIQNGNYILYNSLGVIERQETFQGSEFVIYKGSLKQGIYFLKIENENHIYIPGKILIE